MNFEIIIGVIGVIIGFIGVIITIVIAFYKLHENIKKDRIEIENRLTRIEGQLKNHNIFYDKIQDYMFQNSFIQGNETKIANKKSKGKI
ncbi:MAG: hypothetical protein HF967_08240 [Methanosarcinales archaeon]|nr:hypothetical protein [Methanosarcinales archaeon]